MQPRLTRRRTIAAIAYFLMITALCAPLAFFAGRAQGRAAPSNEPPLLSQNGAGAPFAVALAPETGLVSNGAGPGGGLLQAGNTGPAVGRKSPLRQAVLKTIASGGNGGSANSAGLAGASGSGAGGDAGNPLLSDLLAPGGLSSAAAGGGAGSGSGAGANGGAGNNLGGGFGGPPLALVPAIYAETPTGEPPVLATPLPPATPLMLAGLCGLLFASRGRNDY